MSDEPVASEAGATTRRGIFVGAGAVGAAAVLAACGTDEGEDPYTGARPADDEETSTTPSETPSEAPADQQGEAQGLIATAEVEVGGGVIVNEEIVVTQPTEGEWRGFSAICTHQQCPVTEVADGTINCNCHGSQFSIEDGSVVTGPATEPLAEQAVDVQDGWVVQA